MTMHAYLASFKDLLRSPDAGSLGILLLIAFLLLGLSAQTSLGFGRRIGARHAHLVRLPKDFPAVVPNTPVPGGDEPEGYFRVLEAKDEDSAFNIPSEEGGPFTLLPSEAAVQPHAPRCFICGRPVNEGEHSHP